MGSGGQCLEGELLEVLDWSGRDADADVRQASVYGVGVMAQALGAAFTPHVPASLAALACLTGFGVARPDGFEPPTTGSEVERESAEAPL